MLESHIIVALFSIIKHIYSLDFYEDYKIGYIRKLTKYLSSYLICIENVIV